jgi:hypothetical protein
MSFLSINKHTSIFIMKLLVYIFNNSLLIIKEIDNFWNYNAFWKRIILLTNLQKKKEKLELTMNWN